jgi:hypothetical protein
MAEDKRNPVEQETSRDRKLRGTGNLGPKLEKTKLRESLVANRISLLMPRCLEPNGHAVNVAAHHITLKASNARSASATPTPDAQGFRLTRPPKNPQQNVGGVTVLESEVGPSRHLCTGNTEESGPSEVSSKFKFLSVTDYRLHKNPQTIVLPAFCDSCVCSLCTRNFPYPVFYTVFILFFIL